MPGPYDVYGLSALLITLDNIWNVLSRKREETTIFEVLSYRGDILKRGKFPIIGFSGAYDETERKVHLFTEVPRELQEKFRIWSV